MTLPADRIGDKGQRYQIDYVDEMGAHHCVGWANETPERMAAAAMKMPDAVAVMIIDRERYGRRRCDF